MATTLLSQHSSNPLEVGSSDARNAHYLQRYLATAEAKQGDSSDDPLHGCTVAEKYQRHCPEYYASAGPSRTTSASTKTKFVDLDEDMESEDELSTAIQQGEEDVEEDEGEDEDEDADAEVDEQMDPEEDSMECEPDADGETDEEMTIFMKPPEEQEEIVQEISDLEQKVPQLEGDYKIVDRLGTGTFSSVYKAIDLGYHDKWDNTPWHGHHPPMSSAHYMSVPRPKGAKVFVAVKRIYVTSNPDRIRNEIQIMEECRGCRHTSQLITAFRHLDQVVAIMPFHRNADFRDFYRNLSIQGIKAYFRCMFRALRDIHERGIIHRDVKPANFLFDPRTGIGTLCDFGLASRMEPGPGYDQCLHTFPSKEHPHGRTKHRRDFDSDEVKRRQRDARQKSVMAAERVGYLEKDTRPASKANRAGTRGFRAPEVLFKCGDQTGAIDVWAAGMILLFFLSGKFPIFTSGDDVEALMEIAAIIGRKKMEKVATLHNRTFATNIPSVTPDGISWTEFVKRQNPVLYGPRPPDPRYWPHNQPPRAPSMTQSPPASSSSPTSPTLHDRYSPAATYQPPPMSAEEHQAEVDSALDLLDEVMNPESTKRFTPRQALYHPFLAEEGEGDDAAMEDDDFVPHPFGQGECGDLHFRDDVTEEPCVRISVPCECGECDGEDRYEEILTLTAGEGVAIGNQPCEFHREEFGY